ncbi:MAG: lysozyme inhibitor LprI family protein [Lysobacter sp.]
MNPMKTICVLVLGSLLALPALAAGNGDPQCHAQTQADLNACAAGSLADADRELNATYRAVLELHADEPQFIANLKTAQRLWIQFRDAELAMKFPVAEGERPQVLYGSVYPMCRQQYLTQLTRQRTAHLRAWLEGIAEGDVCTGSLPITQDVN